MQQLIKFKKRNFWSNQLDIDKLNEKISVLNAGGWKIISITSSSNIFGSTSSYMLVVELAE